MCHHLTTLSTVWLLSARLLLLWADENWPQAAGPYGNWQVEGKPPIRWSVVRDANIRWRVPMPEAGMSSVTIWEDHAFVTTHVPIGKLEDKDGVKDIIGFCLSAHTGEILWQVKLAGRVFISLAGGFTDGTVFAPLTDGEHVWFFNRCGAMACYDFSGKEVWRREWTPRFKHNNRQAEPFLVDDTILYVEVANKAAGAKIQKWRAPGKKTKGSLAVPAGVEAKDVWTFIHGIDKRTGKVLWRESAGTVVHNTPVIGRTADGGLAIAHARGGPHQPFEKPAGQSLTSLAPTQLGKTLWSTTIPGFDPSFASHWNEEYVFGFLGMDHLVMDSRTGRLLRQQSVTRDATLWRFDRQTTQWKLTREVPERLGRRHPNTNQANIVIGQWHWFLAHDLPFVGRVNIESGVSEYLELPAQLIPSRHTREQDVRLWGKAYSKNRPTNAGGFAVGDKGHTGSGFGHISAASPIRVGRYLFLPLVTGTVHVIDTSVESLSPDALLSVNDLGNGGETWSLASLSYAGGRLYAHTMREVICIE